MADDLLHEIHQAYKHEIDRNIEFKAERFIREFKAEFTPFILEDLYYHCENKILENQSSSAEIKLFKMIQALVKKKVKFD